MTFSEELLAQFYKCWNVGLECRYNPGFQICPGVKNRPLYSLQFEDIPLISIYRWRDIKLV